MSETLNESEMPPIQGAVNALNLRKTFKNEVVISFQVIGDQGIPMTLGAAAQMLPWHWYENLPEPVTFAPNQLYLIATDPDLYLQTRQDEGRQWMIECLCRQPEPGSKVSMEAALQRIPSLLYAREVIDSADRQKMVSAIQELCGPENGQASGMSM